MCVFHNSQFTFMTRNQAAQPPNIIVDTNTRILVYKNSRTIPSLPEGRSSQPN
jgi:hypothetical protein